MSKSRSKRSFTITLSCCSKQDQSKLYNLISRALDTAEDDDNAEGREREIALLREIAIQLRDN